MIHISSNNKNNLILFRFASFAVLGLFLFLIPNPSFISFYELLPPLFIYLLSNIYMIFVDDAHLQKKGTWWQFAIFLFDILIISWSIYLIEGWTTDLYLVYFPVIFMASFMLRTRQSIAIGAIAFLIYATFTLVSAGDLSVSTHILLRSPFFFLILLYNAFQSTSSKEATPNAGGSIQEDLLHGKKKEGLGHLSSHLASDMVNPLFVIGGFARSLLKKIPKDSELYLPVASISRETERCSKMVTNLLALSDETNWKIDKIDMNTVINNVVDELSLPPQIFMKCTLDPFLPTILGNRKQLLTAINEVLQNSIQAMPKGGELLVSSKTLASKASLPEKSGGRHSEIEISITDTGNGIPDEIKGRIFEPFFTTKEEEKFGLGLSVTSAIVQKHRGRIHFQSQLNVGTQFILRFSTT